MFGLFKKQEKPSEPQWPEFKQLSAQYLPEERTILQSPGPTASPEAGRGRKSCGPPP